MKFEPKTEELIAIGTAVGNNCQSCVEYHVGRGVKLGLTVEEIAAAMEVGRKVRAGAASKMDSLTSTLIEKAPEQAGAGSKGCCGG
jgi:AhpD family alkylhydroperoxidase